jgi:hypothetical protein
MSCCPQNIIPFNGVSSSTIVYTQAMRNQWGRVPRIEIIYADNGEYYVANQLGVRMYGSPVNQIVIDHGGPQTGIIKLG